MAMMVTRRKKYQKKQQQQKQNVPDNLCAVVSSSLICRFVLLLVLLIGGELTGVSTTSATKEIQRYNHHRRTKSYNYTRALKSDKKSKQSKERTYDGTQTQAQEIASSLLSQQNNPIVVEDAAALSSSVLDAVVSPPTDDPIVKDAAATTASSSVSSPPTNSPAVATDSPTKTKTTVRTDLNHSDTDTSFIYSPISRTKQTTTVINDTPSDSSTTVGPTNASIEAPADQTSSEPSSILDEATVTFVVGARGSTTATVIEASVLSATITTIGGTTAKLYNNHEGTTTVNGNIVTVANDATKFLAAEECCLSDPAASDPFIPYDCFSVRVTISEKDGSSNDAQVLVGLVTDAIMARTFFPPPPADNAIASRRETARLQGCTKEESRSDTPNVPSNVSTNVPTNAPIDALTNVPTNAPTEASTDQPSSELSSILDEATVTFVVGARASTTATVIEASVLSAIITAIGGTPAKLYNNHEGTTTVKGNIVTVADVATKFLAAEECCLSDPTAIDPSIPYDCFSVRVIISEKDGSSNNAQVLVGLVTEAIMARTFFPPPPVDNEVASRRETARLQGCTNSPSSLSSLAPSPVPSVPMNVLTNVLTNVPTNAPIDSPTNVPTNAPTNAPIEAPTDQSSSEPSSILEEATVTFVVGAVASTTATVIEASILSATITTIGGTPAKLYNNRKGTTSVNGNIVTVANDATKFLAAEECCLSDPTAIDPSIPYDCFSVQVTLSEKDGSSNDAQVLVGVVKDAIMARTFFPPPPADNTIASRRETARLTGCTNSPSSIPSLAPSPVPSDEESTSPPTTQVSTTKEPTTTRTATPTITPTIDERCFLPNCDEYPDCFQCRTTATPSNNSSSKPSPTPRLMETPVPTTTTLVPTIISNPSSSGDGNPPTEEPSELPVEVAGSGSGGLRGAAAASSSKNMLVAIVSGAVPGNDDEEASIMSAENEENCNWPCYVQNYQDLQNTFGAFAGAAADNDKLTFNVTAAAAHHYVEFGKVEGRDCTCRSGTTTSNKATIIIYHDDNNDKAGVVDVEKNDNININKTTTRSSSENKDDDVENKNENKIKKNNDTLVMVHKERKEEGEKKPHNTTMSTTMNTRMKTAISDVRKHVNNMDGDDDEDDKDKDTTTTSTPWTLVAVQQDIGEVNQQGVVVVDSDGRGDDKDNSSGIDEEYGNNEDTTSTTTTYYQSWAVVGEGVPQQEENSDRVNKKGGLTNRGGDNGDGGDGVRMDDSDPDPDPDPDTNESSPSSRNKGNNLRRVH